MHIGILACAYAHVGSTCGATGSGAELRFRVCRDQSSRCSDRDGAGLVIIGLVAGASRARVFPEPLQGPAAPEEEWPLLRFEPELVSEQAG
jgi:hypothetical protein